MQKSNKASKQNMKNKQKRIEETKINADKERERERALRERLYICRQQ